MGVGLDTQLCYTSSLELNLEKYYGLTDKQLREECVALYMSMIQNKQDMSTRYIKTATRGTMRTLSTRGLL